MSDEKRYLYDFLPDIYHQLDDQQTLDVGFGAEGILSRFMRVFEEEIKLFIKDIQGLPDIFDVDKTPYKFLPYIAYLVGIDFDYNIPEKIARQEIKNINKFYQLKGTLDGIAAYIRGASGFEAIIDADSVLMNLTISINADINQAFNDYQYARIVRTADKFIPLMWNAVFFKLYTLGESDDYKRDYFNRTGILLVNADQRAIQTDITLQAYFPDMNDTLSSELIRTIPESYSLAINDSTLKIDTAINESYLVVPTEGLTFTTYSIDYSNAFILNGGQGLNNMSFAGQSLVSVIIIP